MSPAPAAASELCVLEPEFALTLEKRYWRDAEVLARAASSAVAIYKDLCAKGS